MKTNRDELMALTRELLDLSSYMGKNTLGKHIACYIWGVEFRTLVRSDMDCMDDVALDTAIEKTKEYIGWINDLIKDTDNETL